MIYGPAHGVIRPWVVGFAVLFVVGLGLSFITLACSDPDLAYRLTWGPMMVVADILYRLAFPIAKWVVEVAYLIVAKPSFFIFVEIPFSIALMVERGIHLISKFIDTNFL